MTRRVLASAVLSCLLAACAVSASAGAAKIPVCGEPDADGNIVLGSLALNDNSSTVKTYGTDKGERHLALLYSVEGCTLPAQATIAPEQVSILPPKTGDDLPGKPTVDVTVEKPDTTAVAADVVLKLDDIDPGTHGGIVRIHLPQLLHDSFTPISESRTDSWIWPLLLGLVGSMAGLVWAFALHIADTINIKFSLIQSLVLVALTVGAGLAAGYGYWHNQEVWTLGDNGWATIVSGFTASTTGALVGVTAALVAPKQQAGGETEHAAEPKPVAAQ